MSEFDEWVELRIPHSAEAEQAVIGSILIDPACITDVMCKTRVEDFYLPRNKDVFTAIYEMHSKGKTIDPVTVLDQMKRSGTYTDETQGYLLELMQVTPTAANVMKYVEILNGETMKRQLYEVTDYIKESVQGGMPAQYVCAYVQDKIADIGEARTGSELIDSVTACTEFFNYIDALSDGRRKPYVRSGYSLLDYTLGGGFMNGGLYILAARPGIGKTTIALQIADNIAKSGTPTLFMSLEMPKEQITAKRVAVHSGVNYTKVITGELESSEWKKVTDSCAALGEYPLTINRKPSATVDEIGFLARRVKGLGFIVIDYLGLIRNNNGKSQYEKITDTSNNLKRLSLTLGVPILCLAQLNREVEGRQTNKPRTSDLRDSGAIEQDADGILLLHRDLEDVSDDPSIPTELTCTIGKNRHGRTGEVKFMVFLSSGRIFAAKER